jgi:FkbM family methyltransferase
MQQEKMTAGPLPVDCSHIDPVEPVNILKMAGDPSYFISFSWWDKRLKLNQMGNPVTSNPSVVTIQRLLQNTSHDAALVDVGANVGFMSHYGLALGRPVYAFEPISYNVAKLCEGIRISNTGSFYHLYHAAAGPAYQQNITITRPSNKIGYFDQTSLTRSNVKHQDTVEEVIPLLTVDSIIPPQTKVGVVKIDVQGHEYGVLQGMKQLLSRKLNFPKYVFYENDKEMIGKAGHAVGDSERLLEKHGYTCHPPVGGDILCFKEHE